MFSRELSENEDIYLQKPNLKTEIAGYLIHIESDSPLLVVLTIHIIIAVRRILIKILSVVINDWEQINDFITPPDLLNVATILWAIEIVPMLSIGLNSPMRLDMPAATINAPTSIENPPNVRFSKLYYNFIEL